MHWRNMIKIGVGLVAALGLPGAATALSGYLRTYGPSQVRFASAQPTAETAPFILPPLVRGNHVAKAGGTNQTSSGSSTTTETPATASGSQAELVEYYGPDFPAVGPVSTITPNGTTNAPLESTEAVAPISPGQLLPFFVQPVGRRGNPTVVTPLQFQPPAPSATRSSSATYTKE